MGKRILGWFRRDTVLTISLCLAVSSCLIEPPGPGYLSYIDCNTLITLFCLMLLVEGLREEQFLQYAAARVLSRVRTVRGLLATLVFLCFVGSMLITNDVALLTFVPLGMMMLEMASQRKRLCFAVALMTIAANLGSMFTPIGNPQNLYLFSLSGLSLPEFLGLTAPYTVGAALLLLLCVRFGCGHGTLSIRLGEAPPLRQGPVCFYLGLFLLCVAAGAEALRIISAGFLVSSVSVAAGGALEGLGKGGPSLVISLLRYTLVMIPAAWLLSRLIGPAGVWHAFWLSEAVTALLSILIYRRSVR